MKITQVKMRRAHSSRLGFETGACFYPPDSRANCPDCFNYNAAEGRCKLDAVMKKRKQTKQSKKKTFFDFTK